MTTYPEYASRPGQPYYHSSPYDPSAPYRTQTSLDSDTSQSTIVPDIHKHNASEDVRVDMRYISRTPSPTPSEAEELKKTSLVDWKAMASWKFWLRREYIWYYVIAFIIGVITILFTVYHKQIVDWIHPSALKLKSLPGGWLIPIAIFIVISFPPLFGHEILAIICGLVWGLGIGFAIVAAGTFLGEVANFYAFKHCCAARGEKLEKTKLQYACLAKVVREGGFKIALIARFSAIPGHFTTAVFSTCGMSIWTFSLAAVLSLPKQFLTVYLGVALESSESGGTSTKDTIIRDVVIGFTTVVTIAAAWYIYNAMAKVKPAVIYERRKARQAKIAAMDTVPYGNPNGLQSVSTVAFDGRKSESELPLTANFRTTGFQQWDAQGNAIGYAPDPMLHAPQPTRPLKLAARPSSNSSTPPMSERVDGRAQPVRQNTAGSNGSWDVQGQVGGADSYQMSRQSPYSDPRLRIPASPQTAPSSLQPRVQQQQPSYARPNQQQQQQQQQQPTYARPDQQTYPPPSGPPSLPSDAQRGGGDGGHFAAPTDSSYYSAYSSHGQQPSDDPYIAYQPPASR